MKILTWGICLVVFCLPLYLVRFEIFNIPTTVLELMIYALFTFWLFDKFIQNTKYKIQNTKSLFIPIILILVGVTLAAIFSSDLRTSAGIWKAWFVDPLLFFVVVISVIKNREQVKRVLCSLFLSGTVVSIISLIYLVQGKLDLTGRLQAFYNSPNYLAMYLAPALIIGVWFLSRKVARLSLATFLLSVVCLLLAIIFTQSFGAWLGILAAIASLRLVSRRLRLLILALVLAAVLVLGYAALIHKQSSFDARLIIWQEAWQIFKTNPVLGIGPEISQPHNIFLAFLLQTGLIGFIGFIWLLIWFYKKKTSIVLMIIMTYMLVHGLVDTTYWKNDLAVMFWLVIALYYITNHLFYSQRKDSLQEGKEINQ